MDLCCQFNTYFSGVDLCNHSNDISTLMQGIPQNLYGVFLIIQRVQKSDHIQGCDGCFSSIANHE